MILCLVIVLISYVVYQIKKGNSTQQNNTKTVTSNSPTNYLSFTPFPVTNKVNGSSTIAIDSMINGLIGSDFDEIKVLIKRKRENFTITIEKTSQSLGTKSYEEQIKRIDEALASFKSIADSFDENGNLAQALNRAIDKTNQELELLERKANDLNISQEIRNAYKDNYSKLKESLVKLIRVKERLLNERKIFNVRLKSYYDQRDYIIDMIRIKTDWINIFHTTCERLQSSDHPLTEPNRYI